MALTQRLPALLAFAALACTRPAPRAELGRRVAEGPAQGLRASPDGQWLGFLRACRPVADRTLPAGAASCELAVAPAAGGEARPVAAGVSSLGGWAWAAEGHALAALADFDHAASRGALTVWAGDAPRRLGDGVTFFALDASGRRAAWVAAGRLAVADVGGGAPRPVQGAAGVATVELARRGPLDALARRTARDGGGLLAVRGEAATQVAAEVRDYGFAPDAARFAFTSGPAQALAVARADMARPGPPLGRDVQAFLFSPRGDALAFVADAVPGRQGDLWVAALDGGAPRRLGQRVGEPRWSRDGARLAWLQEYDPRSRTGALAVGAREGEPAVLARTVSDFDLSPDGAAVAFLVHETAGGYSVDLGLARPGGAAPARVARGVFGFGISPDGRWLYYRTACVREAEACDLERVPVAGPADVRPERVAEGVRSFEFAPGRPDRLLVTWSRKDRVALDLALWEAGRLTAVATAAVPGTAQFLGGDPRRLAWAVADPARAGVYVAEVP